MISKKRKKMAMKIYLQEGRIAYPRRRIKNGNGDMKLRLKYQSQTWSKPVKRKKENDTMNGAVKCGEQKKERKRETIKLRGNAERKKKRGRQKERQKEKEERLRVEKWMKISETTGGGEGETVVELGYKVIYE